MFEIVYDGRRTDDGRTDGRRLDGYTISSPCEPNGSGELINLPLLNITLDEIFGTKIKIAHDINLCEPLMKKPGLKVIELFQLNRE